MNEQIHTSCCLRSAGEMPTLGQAWDLGSRSYQLTLMENRVLGTMPASVAAEQPLPLRISTRDDGEACNLVVWRRRELREEGKSEGLSAKWNSFSARKEFSKWVA